MESEKSWNFCEGSNVNIVSVFVFTFIFLFSLLDIFLVRFLDDKNLVFAALKLPWKNEEGLIQQNPKKHIFREWEKIRKRCKEFMKEIWKFQVNETNFNSVFEASKT